MTPLAGSTLPLLLNPYFRSLYGVELPGGWLWSTFARCPLDPSPRACPLPNGALITACNPDSTHLSELVNQRRQANLRSDLENMGCSVMTAIGISPDGVWREPSWFAPTLCRERTLTLARRHSQHATVLIHSGTAGLLLTRTGTWIRRPMRLAGPPLDQPAIG